MVPVIDGKLLHFDNVGLYDALFVMQDKETKTLWNHITGEAVYGPLVGRTLGPTGNQLQVSVDQALVMNPATHIAISNRPYAVNGRHVGPPGPIGASGQVGPPGTGAEPPAANRALSSGFIGTLATEDSRLTRMELGLGLVTEKTVRYYPMSVLRQRGALVDTIDGRRVVIFIDQMTFTPAAIYVNSSSATVDGDTVRLDGGRVVKIGLLFDAGGQRVNAERPQQLFSRWYGFSLTFPNPEIFGR